MSHSSLTAMIQHVRCLHLERYPLAHSATQPCLPEGPAIATVSSAVGNAAIVEAVEPYATIVRVTLEIIASGEVLEERKRDRVVRHLSKKQHPAAASERRSRRKRASSTPPKTPPETPRESPQPSCEASPHELSLEAPQSIGRRPRRTFNSYLMVRSALLLALRRTEGLWLPLFGDGPADGATLTNQFVTLHFRAIWHDVRLLPTVVQLCSAASLLDKIAQGKPDGLAQ